MKKIKKGWMPVVLGTLLMAILVGVASARPMRQTTYKLTIPAAHFHPNQDGEDWYNSGYTLQIYAGAADFKAALPIALPGRFTVEKVTLFALDNNGAYLEQVCVRVYRVNPWTEDQELMGDVCTVGSSSAVQNRSTTAIEPDTIYGGHGGYLHLFISDPTDLKFYSVQIEYH